MGKIEEFVKEQEAKYGPGCGSCKFCDNHRWWPHPYCTKSKCLLYSPFAESPVWKIPTRPDWCPRYKIDKETNMNRNQKIVIRIKGEWKFNASEIWHDENIPSKITTEDIENKIKEFASNPLDLMNEWDLNSNTGNLEMFIEINQISKVKWR